jgi:hypothetical protein
MVHIGSMIGGGLSAAKSKTLHIRLPKMFERIRTDREQRDFISSGAAAGIAAAFGAPIGGALFALEETSSFWSRELTWRSFFGMFSFPDFSLNFLRLHGCRLHRQRTQSNWQKRPHIWRLRTLIVWCFAFLSLQLRRPVDFRVFRGHWRPLGCSFCASQRRVESMAKRTCG